MCAQSRFHRLWRQSFTIRDRRYGSNTDDNIDDFPEDKTETENTQTPVTLKQALDAIKLLQDFALQNNMTDLLQKTDETQASVEKVKWKNINKGQQTKIDAFFT